MAALDFLHSMNPGNVGMIQRSQHAGLILESRHALVIVTEDFREELDSDTAAQLGISCLIHFTHTTCSQMAGDLVVSESSSNHGVNENLGRILPNKPQVTHGFELGHKKSEQDIKWLVNRVPVTCQ